MKKVLIGFVICFIAMFVTVPSVFASNTATSDIIYNCNEDVLVIEVESYEELLILIAEVEEGNRRASELWYAAVEQSEREREEYEAQLKMLQLTIQPRLTRLVQVNDSQLIAIGNIFRYTARFYHTARFTVTNNSLGVPIISNASQIGTHPRNSTVDISDWHGDRVIIDGGRTLAVISSFRLSALNRTTNIWHHMHINRYVEFYNNFTGVVW
ncbi:MAG: hypothetical protein FWB96_09355 [Defluviitaleaceae bacterium]|nr:hypothetical protein [Defluviitaleaceae bacterium]MCL2263030.1 hypothetical protein [Defluviitaleaceae bacterium]